VGGRRTRSVPSGRTTALARSVAPYACGVRQFELVTVITAPVEVVFDMSLEVDVHTQSMATSGERAVGQDDRRLIMHCLWGQVKILRRPLGTA
jgi:hypothetical protein